MDISKPDRNMVAGIVVIIALVVLAATGTIAGGAALGGILGVAASLGVYHKSDAGSSSKTGKN